MTRLDLVVPGLLWPAQQGASFHPAAEVPHAALSRLLGRGRQGMEPAISRECLLARLLGMGRPALPLAALRRLGEEEGGRQGIEGAHWLCADPVNLSFMGGHVLLDEFHEDWGEIGAAEADALIAALNDEFASLGHFSAVTPTRWYLRRESPAGARFFSLDEAVCRPVEDFLPMDGEAAENGSRRWRHALNEIQVALHNHPVNAAREAAGKRTINSLWFWGHGAQSMLGLLGASSIEVQANEPVARGLARAAGIEPGALDADAALHADTLVVLDALASPARHLDLARWQDAFAALERDWFLPISRAFDKGALRQLVLHVPGERAGFSLTLGSRARWHFWRKPLSVCAVHLSTT